MNKPMIIAIAGGSGSGKTFFANALHKRLSTDDSALIYQDNYYIDQSHRFDEDGGQVNFDHPNSIDFPLLTKHLKALRNCDPVQIPKYDFATHSRQIETAILEPKKVIIVEGILVLCNEELRELFDLAVFVETPEEIRFQRRLLRDVQERGRTHEGVFNQFHKQVKPMHDQFVETSKEYANIVSSGTDMTIFHDVLNKVEMRSNITNYHNESRPIELYF